MSRPGFELVSPCPFPTTIIITPRAVFSYTRVFFLFFFPFFFSNPRDYHVLIQTQCMRPYTVWDKTIRDLISLFLMQTHKTLTDLNAFFSCFPGVPLNGILPGRPINSFRSQKLIPCGSKIIHDSTKLTFRYILEIFFKNKKTSTIIRL